jgi:hypothetical protein
MIEDIKGIMLVVGLILILLCIIGSMIFLPWLWTILLVLFVASSIIYFIVWFIGEVINIIKEKRLKTS